MGQSVPAANVREIRNLIKNYVQSGAIEVLESQQIDPDATMFSVLIDKEPYFLLEEDYVSDVEGALYRFKTFGIVKAELQLLLNPPPSFNYEPFQNERPDYFTKEGDDYNRLRLYRIFYKPNKLKYELAYFLAEAGKT